MNKIVKVNNQELSILEWKGQRVITTVQLAEVYGTLVDNVKRNFNRNANKFREGLHYYLLKGLELKEFKNQGTGSPLVSKNTAQLYLWTRRGASRHCKILDTEKAWEQFDCLEENYFNPHPAQRPLQPMPELSPQLQLLINMELKQKEQDAKLAALEQRSAQQTEILKTIKDTLTDKPADFRRWAAKSIGEIANSPSFDGMYNKFQRAWTESYERLMEKLSCDLDQMVKDARKEAEKNGASKTAIRDISRVALIAEDSSLKEVYIGVVKDMLIAYCGEVA